jgi:tetratricopeptide (TPR) repeat protein
MGGKYSAKTGLITMAAALALATALTGLTVAPASAQLRLPTNTQDGCVSEPRLRPPRPSVIVDNFRDQPPVLSEPTEFLNWTRVEKSCRTYIEPFVIGRVRQDARMAEAYVYLARALLAQGRYGEALAELNLGEAVFQRVNVLDHEARYMGLVMQAELMMRDGRAREASAILVRVLKDGASPRMQQLTRAKASYLLSQTPGRTPAQKLDFLKESIRILDGVPIPSATEGAYSKVALRYLVEDVTEAFLRDFRADPMINQVLALRGRLNLGAYASLGDFRQELMAAKDNSNREASIELLGALIEKMQNAKTGAISNDAGYLEQTMLLAEAFQARAIKRGMESGPAYVATSSDLDQADSYCRQALGINPTHADAHACRGMIAAYRGDMSDAVQSFKDADRLGAKGMDFRDQFSRILAAEGDIRGAADQLEKATEDRSVEDLEWLRLRKRLADFYFALGLNEARRTYERLDAQVEMLANNGGENTDALLLLAQTRLSIARENRALNDLARAQHFLAESQRAADRIALSSPAKQNLMFAINRERCLIELGDPARTDTPGACSDVRNAAVAVPDRAADVAIVNGMIMLKQAARTRSDSLFRDAEAQFVQALPTSGGQGEQSAMFKFDASVDAASATFTRAQALFGMGLSNRCRGEPAVRPSLGAPGAAREYVLTGDQKVQEAQRLYKRVGAEFVVLGMTNARGQCLIERSG